MFHFFNRFLFRLLGRIFFFLDLRNRLLIPFRLLLFSAFSTLFLFSILNRFPQLCLIILHKRRFHLFSRLSWAFFACLEIFLLLLLSLLSLLLLLFSSKWVRGLLAGWIWRIFSRLHFLLLDLSICLSALLHICICRGFLPRWLSLSIILNLLSVYNSRLILSSVLGSTIFGLSVRAI